MIFKNPPDSDKSLTLEYKADKLAAKNSWRKAYAEYKKAAELNSGRLELLKKIIAAMEHFQEDWSEQDFVENIQWAMALKELEDPTFKRIHARNEPEFAQVTQLIQAMLKAENTPDETHAAEAIVALGYKALYPLLDYLITLKTLLKRGVKPKDGDEKK